MSYRAVALAIEHFGELPSNEFRVLTTLLHHLNEGDRRCFPGMTVLSKESGYTRQHIRRLLNNLVKKNLVTVKHKPSVSGICNWYSFPWLDNQSNFIPCSTQQHEKGTSEHDKGTSASEEGNIDVPVTGNIQQGSKQGIEPSNCSPFGVAVPSGNTSLCHEDKEEEKDPPPNFTDQPNMELLTIFAEEANE